MKKIFNCTQCDRANSIDEQQIGRFECYNCNQAYTINSNREIYIEIPEAKNNESINSEAFVPHVKKKSKFGIDLLNGIAYLFIAVLIITIAVNIFIYGKDFYKKNLKNGESSKNNNLQVWVSNDTLYIDNFKYSVGIEGENTIGGDFNGLNEKVYTLLQQQTGDYKIILLSKSVDKYGNESKESLYKGLVNANEVNKFSSVDYWIASRGIQDNILKNHTTVNFGEGSPSITTSEYRAANSSQTDASITYNYDGMSDKKWIYHIPENNTFTPITKEHRNYSEVEGKWSGFINDIKDIVVKSSTLQAEVVITNSKGSSDRFTLIKRKEGHFSTNTGDPIDIGFEALPDNSCVVSFFDHNSLINVSNVPYKE